MYAIGNSVPKRVTIRDADDALVDADTTPTATITLPDGTTTTTPVTHVSTGIYSINYTTSATGDHDLVWNGLVGGSPGMFPFTDSFYVISPLDFVVSLDDAKRHLNITTSVSDDELRDFILRAQAAIEARVGPLTLKTVTMRLGRYNSRADALVLPVTPVVSLTTVGSVIGLNVPPAQLSVTDSGVVTGVYGWGFTGQYDVTWVAGRTTCPPDLYLAVLEMLRHLWLTQRGGSSRPARSQDMLANTLPESAYSWPFRVQQLLAPYVQAGFA